MIAVLSADPEDVQAAACHDLSLTSPQARLLVWAVGDAMERGWQPTAAVEACLADVVMETRGVPG